MSDNICYGNFVDWNQVPWDKLSDLEISEKYSVNIQFVSKKREDNDFLLTALCFYDEEYLMVNEFDLELRIEMEDPCLISLSN